MKFLKQNIKTILVIIITATLVGGTTAFATYNYLAKDVWYTKNDGTKISVEDSLNELYNNKSGKLIRKVLEIIDYSGHDSVSAWSENNDLGFGTKQISTTNIKNYQKLTKDNFSLNITDIMLWGTTASQTGGDGVKASIDSYDNENGILTVSIPRFVRGSMTPELKIKVICFYIE